MTAPSNVIRRVVATLVPTLALTAIQPHAWPQDQSVYLVKAFNCPFVSQRMLTGFTVAGIDGIVTALHGVAGCNQIEVEHNDATTGSLQVSRVDVRNDVAILTSSEFHTNDSLTPNLSRNWKGADPVRVIGHPEGIELLLSKLELRTPPTKTLAGLIPRSLRGQFKSRQSPDLAITVLSMQGTLVPGYSGAPILDTADRVIGIADGGLEGGLSQVTWAIPLPSIQLKSAIGNSLLAAVVAKDPRELLSFNTNLPPVFPIKARHEDAGRDSLGEGRQMITEVTISRSGDIDAVTRIHNDVWLSGFCGKVAVWLSDKDGNIVYHGGPTEGNDWCVTARVWGKNDKSNTWHQTIPLPRLNDVRGIAVLQTTGSRNPFEYIQDNLIRARVVRSVPAVK
jgi:hypothetical protein